MCDLTCLFSLVLSYSRHEHSRERTENNSLVLPQAGSVGMLPENVAEALERRKAFEEQFSMTLRSMREELMDTSIKRLSGRSRTPQGRQRRLSV